MGTIRKRGELQWEARVRRRGYPAQSNTFTTKAQADAWVRQIESEMDRGIFVSRAEAERTTLGEALDRYAREVLPSKRQPKKEAQRISQWKQRPLALRPLASIRTTDIATHRDERLKQVAANTVRLELAILSHLFTIASSEWGMEGLSNPVRMVRKPSLVGTERERRLSLHKVAWTDKLGVSHLFDEEERLLAAAQAGPGWLRPIIELALHTGMRRGELVSLTWPDIDLSRRIAQLRVTKNGEPRVVPLSSASLAVLRSLPATSSRLFPVLANTVTQEFSAACKRASITNLRFHDLRHEATSRFFEAGLDFMEVASITGHKTLAMLNRYTHFRAEKLAKKLG